MPMVTGKKNVFGCAANFLRGRKCVFCGSFKVVRTARGYVTCRNPRRGRTKSLARLRREIAILAGFCQLVPAYRLARDPGIDVKAVTRVYRRRREALFHLTGLEAGRLKGEIGLDEACLGGRRKGRRGRGAAGKSVVFGLLERDGKVYTKVVQSVSAAEPVRHIRSRTRTGAVYHTGAFRGYRSPRRHGKHHTVGHSRTPVDRRTKNRINGIEGFWSHARHILYNHRGVSKHRFPTYLKEIECRFNHRKENLFRSFLRVCFGYVSP